MECCSRSTFGVAIALLNVFIYVGVGLSMIIIGNDAPTKSGKFKIAIVLILIVCLIMILMCGLLIFGIYKRLHMYFRPWLVASGLLCVCNSGRGLLAFIINLKTGTPFGTSVLSLLIDSVAVGIQVLICWPIYTLYRDIGRRNGRVIANATSLRNTQQPS